MRVCLILSRQPLLALAAEGPNISGDSVNICRLKVAVHPGCDGHVVHNRPLDPAYAAIGPNIHAGREVAPIWRSLRVQAVTYGAPAASGLAMEDAIAKHNLFSGKP